MQTSLCTQFTCWLSGCSPPLPPSSCNKAVHGRSIRWVLGHAPGDYATFPRLTTSFVEKSFFLRAVIVFIFFLILLILTSEPVLLNKLPLPHSPARTHLLLSIGANCHRHTHKNTHTHTYTHTQCSSIMISMFNGPSEDMVNHEYNC